MKTWTLSKPKTFGFNIFEDKKLIAQVLFQRDHEHPFEGPKLEQNDELETLKIAKLLVAAPNLLEHLKNAVWHLERIQPEFSEEPEMIKMKEAICELY